jgi:hypothetical protein
MTPGSAILTSKLEYEVEFYPWIQTFGNWPIVATRMQ